MKRRPNFSKATFLNLKPTGKGRGAGVTARSLRDSGAGFGMPTTIPNCSVGSVSLQEQGEISHFTALSSFAMLQNVVLQNSEAFYLRYNCIC